MTETASKQKNKFYTTSSAGKDINDLKPLLTTLDAVLVDIRLSPNSEVMFWQQIYLKTLLREKYLHIPQLGNRAHQGNKATIHHLELGIKILTSLNSNAVLMCQCADPKICHRLIIARELHQRGFEIEELRSWKTA